MFQLKVFVTGLLCIFSLSANSAENTQFSRGVVHIKGKTIQVEIAKTQEQHALGLMYRKSLNQDSGMFFIFEESRILSFWMKNTFIPLSIAYIDESLRIVDIQDMSPVTSVLVQDPPSYVSKKPARYALEVNQGFYKKHGILVGDLVRFSETKVQK